MTLQRKGAQDEVKYIDFAKISGDRTYGSGLCYVYGGRIKASRRGEPFVTLYLRDYKGLSISGYIFDLASPLLAGAELQKVIGNVVEIDYRENFLPNVGMTIIINKLGMVSQWSVSSDMLGKFTGQISDIDKKIKEVDALILKVVQAQVSLPYTIKTMSLPEYSHGAVGGLCEHYWRMSKILSTMDYLSSEEYRQLIATFVIYIYVHNNYVLAENDGRADISVVTVFNNTVARLMDKLKVGAGAMELVNIFFGYKATDIYVRTILSVSDLVMKTEKEFSAYQTLPIAQRANVGYGEILRYKEYEGQTNK